MKNTLKKSLVLSILSATVWMSVPSEVFAATPSIADRLATLQARKAAAQQQAAIDADAVVTQADLQTRKDQLDLDRNQIVDQAFDAIGSAEDQIANLKVVARRHDLTLVEKQEAFENAQNAVTQLAARISALRMKAAQSAIYEQQLRKAENLLEKFETDIKDVADVLGAATAD